MQVILAGHTIPTPSPPLIHGQHFHRPRGLVLHPMESRTPSRCCIVGIYDEKFKRSKKQSTYSFKLTDVNEFLASIERLVHIQGCFFLGIKRNDNNNLMLWLDIWGFRCIEKHDTSRMMPCNITLYSMGCFHPVCGNSRTIWCKKWLAFNMKVGDILWNVVSPIEHCYGFE